MEDSRRLLLASFLALEPPARIVKLARDAGNGSISFDIQEFFYKSCLYNSVSRQFPPSRSYLRNVLKQFILAAEMDGEEVIDDLYEEQFSMLSSQKETERPHENGHRCYKSYLYSISDDAMEKLANCLGKECRSKLKDITLTLRISPNMLEGSTGCYAWPAGLFLSEFLLSYPAIFSRRRCLEIGAGAGLNSICLVHLNASKVVVTDGNTSAMDNLKHNFAINCIPLNGQNQGSVVQFDELLWESANEDEVKNFAADVIIGADVIYDPICIPYLVRLLTWLLSVRTNKGGDTLNAKHSNLDTAESVRYDDLPVAFLATVVRNIDTLSMFISSASQAGLVVENITVSMKPLVFLPQLSDLDRSNICLHRLSMSP